MTAPRQLPLMLPLRETSTLESYVTGANQALMASLSRLPAETEQVYVWGDAGSGRSHLLEAVVRRALSGGQAACLLSGAEMLQARVALLEGLESMALIAVDDIDRLAGKPDWEEALFHLYNRVRASGGSLLFSAAQPPAAAGFALPDLASRLAAGPVYQVQPLDDSGRQQLLVARAAARGLEMGADVARFLLMRAPRAPAALLAQLDRLDREAMAQQRRLTVPFVKKVLGW